jgi:hypothetical protein
MPTQKLVDLALQVACAALPLIDVLEEDETRNAQAEATIVVS